MIQFLVHTAKVVVFTAGVYFIEAFAVFMTHEVFIGFDKIVQDFGRFSIAIPGKFRHRVNDFFVSFAKHMVQSQNYPVVFHFAETDHDTGVVGEQNGCRMTCPV